MEFVRLWRTNYARSRLQKLAEKPEGVFRQAQEAGHSSSLWPASYPAFWAAILHLPAEHPVDKVHIQALPDSFRQQIVLLLLVFFRIEDIQLANIQPFPPA